jgi:hypothetical protein
MRGTGVTHVQITGTGTGSQRWRSLLWKIGLATLLFVLLFVGLPSPSQFIPLLVQITVLLWGALFVWLAGSSLFRDNITIRWAWCALTVGAYAALSIPVVLKSDPTKTVDALGPVVALTLAAHLGRHDLQRALRDWAVVMGLSLYTALGMAAIWLVLTTFGLVIFSLGVLLPPLVLEVVLLLTRRFPRLNRGRRYALALLPSTALAVGIISTTQLYPTLPLTASIIFDVIVGVLIGGALLVGLLTRPMTEAASGGSSSGSICVSRALLEFTHGAMLIALAIYIPLRLFTR